MAGVDACYVSSGCNRTSHCLDWGQNGLICYGTCRAVAICRPEVSIQWLQQCLADWKTLVGVSGCGGDRERGILTRTFTQNQIHTGVGSKPGAVLQTLVGHKDRVNCVTWINRAYPGEETEIVSGSVDKTAIVWEKHNDTYKIQQVLSGHTGPVTVVNALYIPDTTREGEQLYRTVVVTASVDSSVKVWNKLPLSQGFTECQTMKYGSGFVLDMTLTVVPNTQCALLACACDDMKVHVYVEQSQSRQFTPVITLAGHEDWVRAVHFTVDDSRDILLASAAQDYLIRVWRFSARDPDQAAHGDHVRDVPLDQDIQMRENTFTFMYQGKLWKIEKLMEMEQPISDDKTKAFAVSLESVLSGHENWIYSVRWKPPIYTDGRSHQEMCILSVSMDKTMILWRPDTESGVWMEQVRVGEVGGNTLGLYGGVFSPTGDSILAHGYQGAFHHWSCTKEADRWGHVVTVSGHFDSVEDIDWDKKGGNFLLSCGLDETVRLHAPWVSKDRKVHWYEIARPQVHGYALQCIAMVTRYQYASGADEKVVRVFDAPDNFVENFCSLCGLDAESEKQTEEARARPLGASVPALGLSNKAIFSDGSVSLTEDLAVKRGDSDQYTDNMFTNVSLKVPPTEEHLLQNSLWPEVQKLYGHGYEIFSLACDPQGKVLASACKAAKAEYASVILWDTETWQQLSALEGHSLTVTQIVFSHTGEFLLTVSRDRTWYMYKRKGADDPESEPLFRLVCNVDKKNCVHSRIIWDCCWTHDDKFFLTASRDKKVALWSTRSCLDGKPDLVCKLDVTDSATAVAMAPMALKDGSYLLAVGLDNGTILLYKWSCDPECSPRQLTTLAGHHLTVKRLKFRPCLGLTGIHGNNIEQIDTSDFESEKLHCASDWLQLASCSMDHSVKIHNIHLPTVDSS